MKTTKQETKAVVDQEIALDGYLQTLLQDIPESDLGNDQLKTRENNNLNPLAPVVTENKPSQDNQSENKSVSKQQRPFSPLTVMPEWTQNEFQALFFKLDHLVLATPLTELSRTIKFNADVTRIPQQPHWFMGLIEDQGDKISVLNTRQLVFGKTCVENRESPENQFNSVLITQDGSWGLVCDEILSISKLQPENVRWRTRRNKRPWLIGTVIDDLAAIVDLNQLVTHKKKNVRNY